MLVEKFLIVKQCSAIAYKKILFVRRSWIKFLLHASLPIFACLIALYAENSILHKSNQNSYNSKEFDITASHINDPIIILSIDSTIPNSDKFINIFKNIAKSENANPVIIRNESLFDCKYITKT